MEKIFTFLSAKISNILRGFCQVKKIQKSVKNSEVGGWVKPQLGFLFSFGNFVFFVLFSCLQMFPKKIRNWIGSWVGGV